MTVNHTETHILTTTVDIFEGQNTEFMYLQSVYWMKLHFILLDCDNFSNSLKKTPAHDIFSFRQSHQICYFRYLVGSWLITP